ncbi:MAG: hypothetical protein LBC99_06780 [Spirochaetota bacterium]|nr:hypothetical protein [Spirochaetota bacterium]
MLPGVFQYHIYARTRVLCLCVLLLCIFACKKNDKYAGYALELASVIEDCSLAAQDAIYMSFDGTAAAIPKAVEQLYITMRREGMYFGGSPMLILRARPDWASGRLQGDLVFLLSPGRGTPEYADRDVGRIQALPMRFAGGKYRFIRYHGPLEALEAGYTRLESFMRSIKPEDCIFLFDDNLRDIENRYHIRLMVRAGDQ